MFKLPSYPVLAASEERSLAIKAQNGDKNAREKLILSNIRFVFSVAKKFSGHGLSDEELVEEGIIGLIEGIDRFDASKGRVTTYSKFWICNAIHKALHSQTAGVHLSEGKSRLLVKLRKAIAAAPQNLSMSEKIRYVAQKVGCSEKDCRELLKISAAPVSFDAPLSESEEDGESILQFLGDATQNLEENFIAKDSENQILALVQQLKPAQREVIIRHYGLFGAKPATFEEIGNDFGKSRARMQQIESEAFAAIRKKVA